MNAFSSEVLNLSLPRSKRLLISGRYLENAVLKNNEAMLYECSGNVIALNNPKRLAVIQGLKDCIVAESGNVLLICKKDDEQRIKQFVADAKIKYGKEYN